MSSTGLSLVVAVSDILSYGGDREPRRRRGRRRLAVVACCAAVALGAALVWYLPRHHGGQPDSVSPGPCPAAEAAGPAAQGAGSAAGAPDPLPTQPALMTGQPLPPADSVRVLLGGQRRAWLLLPSGRTEPVRGLPAGGNGYLVPLAGGWATQPSPPDTGCAPSAPPVYYIADGSPAATRIGVADDIAPAAAAGAVWLVSYQPGAVMSTAAGTAQEVSVAGAVLGPPLTLPAGYVIDQETRAGLLLVQEQAGSGPVRYELWDPDTGRVTQSFTHVLAASPTEVAWMPACAASCSVRVLELPGGQTRQISLPGRSTAWAGAFSPDGGLLALQVTAGVTAGGRAAATRLMVATVATGQLTAVPGTTLGGHIGVAFGWQPGGRLIADVSAEVRGQPEWQIAVWQPGDPRLSTALVQVPGQTWPVVAEAPY